LALLEVRNLKTFFYGQRGIVKAVNDVSFVVYPGQTLGLVGESGCGKSMSCLSIMRLVPEPGRIVSGEIIFDGQNLLEKTEREMRRVRGRRIAIILQDLSSLNPSFSIGRQVAEAIHIHQGIKGRSLWEKTIKALKLVRIPSPEERLSDYPHMLSGGMRQRVVGAIAFSCEPDLLIADEPTTALDVTTQAVYLQLLKDIQKERGLAMIFVTHDFGIVAMMCDEVAVMYAGRILEKASVREIFDNPVHPYTRALMNSVPKLETVVQRLQSIPGQPPELYSQITGCAFRPRCGEADDRCVADEYPPEVGIDHGGHWVRCWRVVGAAAGHRP